MRVSAEVCIVPIGVGRSLSAWIATCERIFRDAGLEVSLHAHGTNVEGDWDAVTAAIRRCHEALHEDGAPRIHTAVKLNTAADRPPDAEAKVQRVRAQLGEAEGTPGP